MGLQDRDYWKENYDRNMNRGRGSNNFNDSFSVWFWFIVVCVVAGTISYLQK